MDIIIPHFGIFLWSLFLALFIALPIFALTKLLTSSTNKSKVPWVLVIILLPCLGSILYFLIGKRKTVPIEAI